MKTFTDLEGLEGLDKVSYEARVLLGGNYGIQIPCQEVRHINLPTGGPRSNCSKAIRILLAVSLLRPLAFLIDC